MVSQPCFQGNIASQPELGFPGLCLQDAPSGVRFADFVSVFPAGSFLPACPSSRAEEIETHFSLDFLSSPGINAASTFDRKLMHARGVAMGEEFRDKGVNIALGPAIGLGVRPSSLPPSPFCDESPDS